MIIIIQINQLQNELLMCPLIDEDFDFQDLEQPKKKQKTSVNKKNNQFDFEVDSKQQKKQTITKKNKPGSMDNEFLFDDLDEQPKLQTEKKYNKNNNFEEKNYSSNQNKNQSFKLPAISIKEQKSQPSPTNAYLKNKNLTTLERLQIKKFQVQKKKSKNKSFQDQNVFNQQIEDERSIINQIKQVKKVKKQQISQTKTEQKLVVDVQKHKQIKLGSVQKKQIQKIKMTAQKKQSSQDQNQYQEELFQQINQQNTPNKKQLTVSKKQQVTASKKQQLTTFKKQQQTIKQKQQQVSKQQKNFTEKQPQKANNKLIEKNKIQTSQVNRKESAMSKTEDSKLMQKQNETILQTPITKYKELVLKNFPDQQESKVSRMKSDAINRINDKIRDMIKGFSNQLTNLIDKNLVLLQKNQKPQIQEQIQGDPIANQLEVLRQNKKNNQKTLTITGHQLQNLRKQQDKMEKSTEYIIRLNQEIETHKNHVCQNKKTISNIKNEVQKQGKKVMALPQENSDGGQKNGNFKNSLSLRVSLVNLKSQCEKHAQKLKQLQKKMQSLQQKLSQVNVKKNNAIEKAEQNGLCLCSKQDKNKYEQLKKKRDQLSLFQSKHKNSIKSKEAVINHQISELQVLLNDYNQKFQTISQSVEFSKAKIFEQIRRAKKSQYVKSSIKQVLQKLQDYMNDDKNSTVSGQQNINSLQYISDKIYRREYSNSNMKNRNKQPQVPQKKVYKNYLKQISSTQENIKRKQQPLQQASKKKQELSIKNQNQRYSQKINSNVNDNRGKKIQTEQKQRRWTERQTESNQNSSLNPFKNKKNNGNVIMEAKSLALRRNEQKDIMKNQQLMKLIDKNKEKIEINQKNSKQKPTNIRPLIQQKQQKPTNIKPQIQQTQQKISQTKKPFQFKLNPKSRLSNKTQQIHQNITSQRLNHQKPFTINSRQETTQKQKVRVNVPVKLVDKDNQAQKTNEIYQQNNAIEQNKTIQQKINTNSERDKVQNQNNKSSNINPFKSFKLKKDNNRSSGIQSQYQNKYKIYQQPIKLQNKQQNQLKLPWEINSKHDKPNSKHDKPNEQANISKIKTQYQKQAVFQQNNKEHSEQASNDITIRPRRLMRKKPQQQESSGYKATTMLENKKQFQIKQKINENKLQIQVKQKKEQEYNPFKKFLQNKDKEIQVTKDLNHNKQNINLVNLNSNSNIPLSISNNLNQKQSPQENKPKMILFKKNKEEIKKQQLLTNQNNITNIVPQEQSKQEDQQKYVRKQREGRLKKQKPNLNQQNNNKNNIYDNVDDLTIKLLGQQQSKQKQPQVKRNLNIYEPTTIKSKQMNLNDILGLPSKNKNNNIETDLLLDVNTNKKVQPKVVNKKKNDFFEQLQI